MILSSTHLEDHENGIDDPGFRLIVAFYTSIVGVPLTVKGLAFADDAVSAPPDPAAAAAAVASLLGFEVE
ncbi:protein of unknown function [Taphrina deformans PYCC 5710]|uniref:Uncharacterized protein n=1 Tax=Taphrina deformans (strain PYCC 5710 / ATCC 11124 / CBS 356.35 / IMI 108563 / JCM 9778 / NBRC 8474) TaxID=1097556 RepID=R4X6K1_TAPDE|nr:protein of unknown function [Taphrina deformans PYCC 5710]|eukprot:CCG80511.1 protein of unknown function [Taphrina deformans PYCC 5710]